MLLGETWQCGYAQALGDIHWTLDKRRKEYESGLLRRVATDSAIRQSLLQFNNLSLGEVGVVDEIQLR